MKITAKTRIASAIKLIKAHCGLMRYEIIRLMRAGKVTYNIEI
jgi:hypothetical protein